MWKHFFFSPHLNCQWHWSYTIVSIPGSGEEEESDVMLTYMARLPFNTNVAFVFLELEVRCVVLGDREVIDWTVVLWGSVFLWLSGLGGSGVLGIFGFGCSWCFVGRLAMLGGFGGLGRVAGSGRVAV